MCNNVVIKDRDVENGGLFLKIFLIKETSTNNNRNYWNKYYNKCKDKSTRSQSLRVKIILRRRTCWD